MNVSYYNLTPPHHPGLFSNGIIAEVYHFTGCGLKLRLCQKTKTMDPEASVREEEIAANKVTMVTLACNQKPLKCIKKKQVSIVELQLSS